MVRVNNLESTERTPQQCDRVGSTGNAQNEAVNLRRQESFTQGRGQQQLPKELIFTSPYISKDCPPCSAKPTTKPDCPTFKPDYERKTEGARNWDKDATRLQKEPLKLDKEGKYEAQKGDSLWGIAERSVTGGKGKGDPTEVTRQMQRIIDANKEKYPYLDCNPHLLQPGAKLTIPGDQAPRTQDKPNGTAQSGQDRTTVTNAPKVEQKPEQKQPSGRNDNAITNAPKVEQKPEQKQPSGRNDNAITNAPRPEQGQDQKRPGSCEAGLTSPPKVEQNPSAGYESGITNAPRPGQKLEQKPGAITSGGADGATRPGDVKAPGKETPPYKVPSDLIGKRITDLAPEINPRLGCTRAVTEVLHREDPRVKIEVNNHRLAQNLESLGYQRVPLDQVQPGDVIIGKRPGQMPGHAAICVDKNTVFENNSDMGRMGHGSMAQFREKMHKPTGQWNANGYSDVVVYRKPNTASAAARV